MNTLITLRQVGASLHLHHWSVSRLIKSGYFAPSVIRVGHSVRFRQDEVEAWIEAGCPAKQNWKWNATRAETHAGRQV